MVNDMKATRPFIRTFLNRAVTALPLIIMSLALAALIVACSDPVEATPEVIPLTDAPPTPTPHDETPASVASGVQDEDSAELPTSSETGQSMPPTNAGAEAEELSIIRVELPPDDTHIYIPEFLPDDTYVSRPHETGPVELDERILRADVIARATFISISTTTPFVSDADLETTTTQYVSTLELRFDVHEYLKGSGGDTLLVELPLSFDDYYPSAEEAVAAATAWFPTRYTRWDNREAIIFVQNPIGSQAQSSAAGSNKYVFTVHDLGYVKAHDIGTAYAIDDYYTDTYSIRSAKNKVWLPDTSAPSSGASVSAESSYYLEEPPLPGAGSSGQGADVPVITLSELKSRVRAMDELLKQGEGVSGYRRCLEEKYAHQRALKTRGWGVIPFEFALGPSSGLPAGSVIYRDRLPIHEPQYSLDAAAPGPPYSLFGDDPGMQYSRFWFVGPDADLFRIGVKDDDSDPSSYSVVATTARPLPLGWYEMNYIAQNWLFFPCDYIPNSYPKWVVLVIWAPSGTLHEAFFDPVSDTSASAVGAGDGRGVLDPSSFIAADGATATISSLAWESGAVKIRLSPHTALAGQRLDFIEMDGTASLSLHVPDAALDAANDTLSWAVDSQPWEDGDTLMLRIRASSRGDSGQLGDSEDEDTPIQRVR